MAADEKLAEELAEHLAERDGRRSLFTDALDATERAYRDEYRRTARVALEWLAERERLIPDGASVEEQWGVRWPDDRPHPMRRDVQHRDRAQAEWYITAMAEGALVLSNGTQRAMDGQLIHRTVITGPWEPAPEEANRTACFVPRRAVRMVAPETKDSAPPGP